MISLERSPLIGKGSSRHCYQHPADLGKCVKVEEGNQLKVTSEELKHYRKLRRRGISWDMVACYHETVLTDRGPGAVFDMPRDYDGLVSRTLHHYLSLDELVADAHVMVAALKEFKTYLLSHNIVLRELKPDNVVWCRYEQGKGKFVLIDGIGNNQFLPIATYMRRLGSRVIGRKWATFERDLRDLYPESPLAKELLGY